MGSVAMALVGAVRNWSPECPCGQRDYHRHELPEQVPRRGHGLRWLWSELLRGLGVLVLAMERKVRVHSGFGGFLGTAICLRRRQRQKQWQRRCPCRCSLLGAAASLGGPHRRGGEPVRERLGGQPANYPSGMQAAGRALPWRWLVL